MQDFHLIRAPQARPFLMLLEETHAPVESLARQTGLPLSAVREQADGVIGEFALWQFIERGAVEAAREHLGYECAEAFPLGPDYHLGDLPLRLGTTLERTLSNFNEDIMHLSTASYYSLDRRSGACWFRRVQAFGRERASWQAELYTVATLLQVIRIHAGKDWQPAALRFSATDTARSLPTAWSAIPRTWGADATGILLDDPALALPPAAEPAPGSKLHRKLQRPTFRELVVTQVNAACTGIENAAEQTGVSVSTLQRHLNGYGTSYQEILEEVRQVLACELLTESTAPVAVIAESLGYTHLGNFSRAFSRWTGLTPTAYRTGAKPN